MTNRQIADALDEIGELLEIKGESRFRVIAYEKAARAVDALERDLMDIYQVGELTKIPGIGSGIADKITEILLAGSCKYLEELRAEFPSGLRGVLRIPGVGPKTAKLLYEQLGIDSPEALKEAAESGRIRSMPRLGAKTESNILRGMSTLAKVPHRLLLVEASSVANKIVDGLKKHPAVVDISPAGSLRRMAETIGDVDILVASNEPEAVIDELVSLPTVAYVIGRGETKVSILTGDGLQVDLRVLPPEQWGSALLYFTGSKAHNVHLREIARATGRKLSEYGLFDAKTGKVLAGRNEEDIYAHFGMDWMPPVLREDRGEVEAALAHELPELVTIEDLRGDLHAHTKYSDGVDDARDMVQMAVDLGYDYMAITDHAEKLGVAGGLKPEKVREQRALIDELRYEFRGRITILHGTETNIDNEGQVDWPEDFLSEFDVVIASIHGGFRQSKEQITRRMCTAMQNPHVHIIGHPTGRLLGKREPYQIDLEEVFKTAAQSGTALELNSFPDRLDLKDEHLKAAKGYGCRFSLGTDAHRAAHMGYRRYGVATAQRGWLSKGDLVNCLSLESLRGWLSDKSSFARSGKRGAAAL